MYIDINNIPPNYNAQEAINAMRQQQMLGGVVNDPTQVINTSPGNGSGLFSATNTTPFNDPWENPMKEIEERIKKLETDNKFLRLKILSMEGKFTQDEVTNIRKMLISEDESSRTLAESIIENA
jgi:hypothetical protein